ncbi:MAG: hypothetical protein ACREES_11005 [Stellaceae bacterium]
MNEIGMRHDVSLAQRSRRSKEGRAFIPAIQSETTNRSVVMAGLDPAIHAFKTWMPGTTPGMTE